MLAVSLENGAKDRLNSSLVSYTYVYRRIILAILSLIF